MLKKCLLILAMSLASIQSIEVFAMTCSTEESCATDSSCLCYCSGICEFREKKADDAPVYVPNDPSGNYCYCKQWDLDVFNQNCSSPIV